MKKIYLVLGLALVALAGTTSAEAHDSIGFSITLGAPVYYVGPPVVYASPPVYYSEPPVVYYEPAPVYYVPNGYIRYYEEPRATVTIMVIIAAGIDMVMTTMTMIDRKQL